MQFFRKQISQRRCFYLLFRVSSELWFLVSDHLSVRKRRRVLADTTQGHHLKAVHLVNMKTHPTVRAEQSVSYISQRCINVVFLIGLANEASYIILLKDNDKKVRLSASWCVCASASVCVTALSDRTIGSS